MAGDLHVPKSIWSPAGGFFADPKKWPRNTVLVAAAMAAIAIPLAAASRKWEDRHTVPGPSASQ